MSISYTSLRKSLHIQADQNIFIILSLKNENHLIFRHVQQILIFILKAARFIHSRQSQGHLKFPFNLPAFSIILTLSQFLLPKLT